MSIKARLMNPFPGLRPFRQDEDYLFFGREEQTMELLQLLGKERFVAVVGTSGSGKSSLVRCGLLSELLGGKLLKAGASWEVAVAHPGGNPLALLAEAILDADLYDRNQENARENLLATLSRSHFGLVEAIKQARLGEDVNFLLVVDQFEEIFRFHEAGQQQQEAANEFVSLLLESVAQTAVPIYIVITMRSDFIGDCGEFEGLAEMVNRGEFLIPRLSREQFKRVIEAPIKVAGGRITPRLLQRLLNDLGQQADQLPCLQHALMRTWSVWSQRGDGDALDLEDYQRVGRMSEALSLHADEIFNSLESDRQRDLCAGMFKALTVQESENRGIRRPQRLGSLCQILDVPAGELLPIIDAYRQQGVTFLMPSQEVELTERTIIDISHESLMRVWTRLRYWVEEEAQAAGIYLRLSESAALYERGKSGLYRDPELGIALAWWESERPNAAWAERYRPAFHAAMAFLEASRQASAAEEEAREAARRRELEQARQLAEAQQLRLEQQQRAASRLRLMIAGLAAVAVIAGIACVAALFANRRAITLAVKARQNEEKARQNEENAHQNASRAEASQQETAKALALVASQKREVEGSLSKAETAERVARAAEETGRKLLYTNDMRLAPFVWRDDRTTAEQLRVLLAKHVPDPQAAATKDLTTAPLRSDLRGFEWYYYQHLLQSSAMVFSGHGESVIDAAFTAEGTLVTLDEKGQLRRWDLGTQHEDEASRLDLPGGPGAQFRVLSPNGRRAALAEGNKVHVFDTSTGRETFQIDSSNQLPRRMIFTRDGDRLVIVDDKIRWCNAASGEVIAFLDEKFDRIESLALATNGLTLAVVGQGYAGSAFSIFRLDSTTRRVIPLATRVEAGETLGPSALSPDGQRLAVGWHLYGVVRVFDTAKGFLIARHGSAHGSPISATAFSGDGTRLATADAEGTIKIWTNVQNLNSKSAAIRTLKGHGGEITSAGFSSGGERLVTTSADKTARVWNLDSAGEAIRPLDHTGYSAMVRFSPDGQLIAAASGRSVRLWDTATGRLVRELPPPGKGHIFSVAFSPTDHRLLAVGYGGDPPVSCVALWDIDAGTEQARLPGATDLPGFPVDALNSEVGALAFSPDGKYLVAGFGSKNWVSNWSLTIPLKIWEVATRRLIRRLNGHTNYCVALDFSRDGTLLASGSRDGTAILWSTATWKATRTLQNPDTDTLYRQSRHGGMVEDVAFSPDGKTLAMASREANVHLWDVASGKVLDSLRGHSSAVTAVVFSPDGRTLASGSIDQTVRLWNVATRRELMRLDPDGVELGPLLTLAFSPDGAHLLAGGEGLAGKERLGEGEGSSAAFWSDRPIIWNDPDRAAAELRGLLHSNADFQSRIRMLSENLRLHEALSRLDAKDKRVQAALAATQANWHASRKAWPEAVAAFDRWVAADPSDPAAWFRTPGLIRLATALLHQNRPALAATLLQGGAKRRSQDGLAAVVDKVGVGVTYSTADGAVRVTELSPGFPSSRAGLRPGDTIVKVNDSDLTPESIPKLGELLAGEAGTKVRLTVQHSGSDIPEVIELTRERFVNDPATGELLYPLRALVKERLDRAPRDAGLLELRAELAGQWSDAKAQAADYTAAIAALFQQKPAAQAADLQRLYRRRGDAYLASREWQQAADDYARGITTGTTDDAILANQALAQANAWLDREAAGVWTVLKPIEAKSEGGASLSILPDNSILAGGENPRADHYRVVLTVPKDSDLLAVRLEALTHPSLPGNGPGRARDGMFNQREWSVTATSTDGKTKTRIQFQKAWADNVNHQYPINPTGHWNIWNDELGSGMNRVAIWALREPVRLTAGMTLTVEMQHWPSGERDNLGRFRIAVSANPQAIDKEAQQSSFMRRPGITTPWVRLATVDLVKGDQRAIDQLVEQHPKLAGPIGDLFAQGKDEDKDWRRALALYSKGITKQTTDVDLLSRRAHAHEALKDWDAAAADWSRAASLDPEGAKLLTEFARRLAAANQRPLAKAQFEKSEALYVRSLRADPENDLVAAELAQLLLDKEANEKPTRWEVLKPSEMKSQGGASLTLMEDGSILSSGKHPERDDYIITAPTDVKNIAAIALDVLPHESLGGSVGRGEHGQFFITELELSSVDHSGSLKPVAMKEAVADIEQTDSWGVYAAREVIDGKSGRGWGVSRQVKVPHRLVVQPGQPIAANTTALTFIIRQHHFNSAHKLGLLLGRFRLSVSSDPAAFEKERTRFAAMKLSDPWARLGAAYHVIGHQPALDKLLERHPAAAAGIGDLYASRQDWQRALAEYDKAISGGSQDARTFAARADAHEKLEHWELAAADWGNADLHALNKRERYNNNLYLEHRIWMWPRLQQFEKKLQDCNELLKPEREGDSPWAFILRGEAYDGLRRWQEARADYDRAIRLSLPAERGAFYLLRARHFAAQGQWKAAADDMHQAYQEPTDFLDGSFARAEWFSIRDAVSIYAVAGDVENYDRAVAECYRKQAVATPNPDDSRWTVLTMLLFPEMITDANRPRLLELAGRTDAYWRPRLTAAIHYRSGDFQKAAELFDANDPGSHFFFLAAMTYHKVGRPDHAKQRLEEGNTWLQQQREKDPGAGVPRPQYWQDWATLLTLQYEASELILGTGSGSNKLAEHAVGEAAFQAALAQHLAARGNAPTANAARTRVCALFAVKLAQEPANAALAADLLSAYQLAGRTRDAIPHLAKASAANPKDTLFSLKLAAFQAWFGQEKELAATRQRVLTFAKGTREAITAERAAKLCSILPSPDKADVAASLELARSAMKLGNGVECWNLLALGMAQYRGSQYADAEKTLLAAAEAARNVPADAPHVTAMSSFFRAMSLFRLGKKDEARQLATAAAAKMKPLPADEQNPLAASDTDNDLILWLVYKEAKALIHLDEAHAAPATVGRK